jgi:hypothetical protein
VVQEERARELTASKQSLEVISGLEASVFEYSSRKEESAKELEVAKNQISTLETLLSEAKAKVIPYPYTIQMDSIENHQILDRFCQPNNTSLPL